VADVDEGSDENTATGAWLSRPIVSLSHPRFRFLWLTNIIVAVGLMVQFTARGWLIVRLTDSALLLGAVEGVFGLSFALGSLPMGLLADRMNRRNLLAYGNTVALMVAVSVGLLVAFDVIEVWYLLVTAAIAGVLMAMRFPVQQAMTARLVPEGHLMNAVSLNTASHSAPSVAGPAVGGVLIGTVGIAAAYFVTGGALALALILFVVGVPVAAGHVERVAGGSIREDFREAYEYLRSHRDLLKLTAVVLIPFILGQSYILLLALFVQEELGRGPETFGVLSASLGAGGLLGAMAVATFGQQRQIGLLMFAGVLGTGVSGIVYGFSEFVVLTGGALFVAGATESALFASYETYLVMRLPDELRGRVTGLMFTLVAMFPVSAIAAGAIADQIGLRLVAIIEGAIIIGLAAIAWQTVLRFIGKESG